MYEPLQFPLVLPYFALDQDLATIFSSPETMILTKNHEPWLATFARSIPDR